MNLTQPTTGPDESSVPPKGLPPRLEFVEAMLDATKRQAVPVRSTFVQQPRTPRTLATDDRSASLAKIIPLGAVYLDALLLIHAMASSSAPYESIYPAGSWAHALGLNEESGDGSGLDNHSAKAKWSKVTRKLIDLKLLARRRAGNTMVYGPLDESGSGVPYVRPTKRGDYWFNVPGAYWRDDYYRTLGLAAKVMLLIALSEKDGFALPLERAQQWYGVSRSTAQRGFDELVRVGILTYDVSYRVEPKSATGWAEVRMYHLQGPWSLAARTGTAPTPIAFVTAGGEEVPAASTEGSAAEDVAPDDKTSVSDQETEKPHTLV